MIYNNHSYFCDVGYDVSLLVFGVLFFHSLYLIICIVKGLVDFFLSFQRVMFYFIDIFH